MRGRRAATAVAVVALAVAALAAGVQLTSGSRQEPVRDAGTRTGYHTSKTPSPVATPDADRAPRSSVPPGSQPLGLKWSRAQPDTFGFVANAGGGWTFTEVLWCDVEPRPGVYQWAGLDAVVREARRLGHEPMLKLRTGQCWGTEPPSATGGDSWEGATKDASTPPVSRAQYLAFVRAVVQRYAARGVDVYAVENEPDTVNHWAASVAAYRDLARAVARTIHRVHPAAHVLDGGPSSTSYGVAMAAARIGRDPDGALEVYRAYYARRLAGSVSRFPEAGSVAELRAILRTSAARRSVATVRDALRLADRGATDGYQLHFYEPADQLPAVLGFLGARLANGVPLEAWEVGAAWPGDGYDELAHATETFRIVGLLLEAGARPIVHLPAAYSDAPGKIQVFRGLVESDGTVLPAGSGWDELTEALAGLHGLAVEPAREGLTGAVWSIGRRQAALVWSAGPPVPLDPADVERIVAASGATEQGAPVVGADPVLVLGSARGDLAKELGRG